MGGQSAEMQRRADRRKELQATRDRINESLTSRDGLDLIEPPEPLHHGMTYKKTLARMSSKPGLGKTFMALDMALSAALGIPWLGRKTEQVRVLYLIGEGVADFSLRVAAWEQMHDRKVPAEAIDFLPLPMALHEEDSAEVEVLTELVSANGYELVVIDTQARFTAGMEENSNSEAGVLVENLDRLKNECGACVLLIHHTTMSSQDRARGASAISGAVDTDIVLVPTDKGKEFRNYKQKYAQEAAPFTFRLEPYGPSAVIVAKGMRSPNDTSPRDMFARPEFSRGPLGSEKGDKIPERAAYVLWRSWQHGTSGASRTEWRAAMQGDEDLRITSSNVPARFGEALSTLESRGWLAPGATPSKFLLSSTGLEGLGVGGAMAPIPREGEPGSEELEAESDGLTAADDEADDDAE